LAKAHAAATQAAQRRLEAACNALQAALPAGGVVLDSTLRLKGCPAVRVLLLWPGVLQLHGADGALREFSAASWLKPVAQGGVPRDVLMLLHRKTPRKPLLTATFQPPQGQRLKASFDLSGVVQVRAARDGALLAESEPGQPHTLRAGFVNFAPGCFAPRLD
jgi:hypothetical protein